MSQTPADHSIPLLTEIIAAVPAAVPATASSADVMPSAASSSMSGFDNVAPSVQPPLVLSAGQLLQLRQELEENLMQRLLGQVNDVLHQHLQDHLAVVLDNMADILKSRVRIGMEQALAETVTRALKDELAAFENAKK